ncbi:FUSC family protein [Nocardiopsis potens]|uniref:FUSC family protein n=1 Tax=Nocardiopsis potens TaxID=1246458 RepID=UPI00034A40F0|nr:FUSC family protein [Nocardiopsis potens]
MKDLPSSALRLRRALGVRAAFAPRRLHGNILVTAVRAGLCVLAAVGSLYALDRPDLAPYAALGCFTALYARDDSYARRGWVLALVGTGLTASVALGGLVAPVGGLALPVLVVALVAAAAKYASDALALGPPGGLMFVFAAGVAAYTPQSAAALPGEVAITAGAALFCWCAALAGRLAHPLAPQRLAVSRALIAAARHLEAAPRSPTARHAAHQAVQRAWSVLGEAPRGRRAPVLDRLEALTARAEALLPGAPDPVRDARTAAELYELARRTRRRRSPDLLASPAEAAVLAARARERRAAAAAAAGPRRLRLSGLREALRRPSPTPVSVLRIFLASAAAGLAGAAFGIEHGYWAAVSAGAVLQSVNVTATWHRTLQRGAGTVVGALLAAALFTFADPAPWQLIALVALCQACAELLVLTNYGYAIVFVTPLTVALSRLAHPAPAGELVAERVAATLLGAAIGVAVSIALVNRGNSARLAGALAACRRARAELAERTGFGSEGTGADGSGAEGTGAARDRLSAAVVALREAHIAAQGEPWAERPGDEEVLAAEHEAYELLARTARTAGSGERQGAAVPAAGA